MALGGEAVGDKQKSALTSFVGFLFVWLVFGFYFLPSHPSAEWVATGWYPVVSLQMLFLLLMVNPPRRPRVQRPHEVSTSSPSLHTSKQTVNLRDLRSGAPHPDCWALGH